LIDEWEVPVQVASNPYFRATMEFFHDIAAGAFPGAVLAAWMIRGGFAGASPNVLHVLAQATVSIWLILLGAAIVLGATGALRLGYWQLNIRQGFLATKKRMVLLKHTAFALLLVASVVAMFALLPM
jgi:hypothetical protein